MNQLNELPLFDHQIKLFIIIYVCITQTVLVKYDCGSYFIKSVGDNSIPLSIK